MRRPEVKFKFNTPTNKQPGYNREPKQGTKKVLAILASDKAPVSSRENLGRASLIRYSCIVSTSPIMQWFWRTYKCQEYNNPLSTGTKKYIWREQSTNRPCHWPFPIVVLRINDRLLSSSSSSSSWLYLTKEIKGTVILQQTIFYHVTIEKM